MKKIFYSLIALSGMLLAACTQEHIEVQINPNNLKAQALGNIEGCQLAEDGENITTTYSEAEFGLPVTPAAYVLYVDVQGDNFEEAKKVDATIANGVISFGQKKFNKIFLNMGYEPNTTVNAEFRLDAFIQTDKGVNIEKYVQHSNIVTAAFVLFEETKGELDVVDVPGDYQGWAPSDYPKLFNYSYDGINYRGVVDFQCKKEDGTASTGFKFTYGGDWSSDTGNWGSEAQAEAPEAASFKLINGDASQNIMCYGAHRYYLFNFDKDELIVNKEYGFDKVGVIGLNGDWDNDIVMDYNMYFGRFWADVDVLSDTEFKFRLDGGWDNNWGGDLEGLTPGGANIPIPAGQYRIYFYMGTQPMTAEINSEMYGNEEPTIKPVDPPAPAYQGWGIIGVGGDWEKDIEMNEIGGTWTGYANILANDSFKLRKDAAWDENRGAPGEAEPYVVALDTPVAATANGKNLAVPADGFYKIVYNTADETITVSDGTVWGVIGAFNEWAGDVFMTEEGGVWTSPAIELKGGDGFKIRKNSAWDENRGATGDAEPYQVTLETPLDVVNNGKNLCVEKDGKYFVIYDANAETITVNNAAKSWGLVGDFTGWGSNPDVVMNEVVPGIWVSPRTTIADGGWKVRFDAGWDQNFGGNTPAEAGKYVQAIFNGENINLHGDLIVVLNLNNGTLGTLVWGITGSIASVGINWDNDIPMNLASDGLWVSCPVALTTADQIKIRKDADWAENFGGTCTKIDEPFEAVAGGGNITVPADGTYVVIYNPETGQISISSTVCGLIGDFNGWSGDEFMFYAGEGKFYSFNRHYEGGWKIRFGADWACGDRGGTYEWNNPFTAVPGGPNITVSDIGVPAAGFNVIYDSVEETITINQEIIL
ncbi:MAG: SusE domain-containing protein [Bacteroidales bacterium]|nr:SusE domain-containing protein [Bacteroidales bacterium]